MKKRDDVDSLTSSRAGISGFLESILRRFKTICYLLMILPFYALGCVIMGVAAAPGFWVFNWLSVEGSHHSDAIKYIYIGTGAASAFFIYGFCLLAVVPFVNWALRANLKEWRGPYYSLEAIRWYMHNGFTYVVRYTFLEFVTPTPFGLAFYRAMGMKIGSGTAINSTAISDPSMIVLGKKVTIGGSATIVAHYGQGGYLVLAPTIIEDGVTVGLRAVIMGGVKIGAGAKVLPNSVVLPKTVIPAGETWGGVPARKVTLDPA
jgi:acetyltransferase-like isoleucine patch superfamily enzyme